MRAAANPLFVRALIVLVCATAAFLLGLLAMRALRKKISEEAELSPTPSQDSLPLHLYNNVIQQLKQQKHELHVQSKSEQQRARISEILNQAVLANLSTGVLVLGASGLVKTANPAAKEILGFASLAGMNAENIFRNAAPASRPGLEVCSEETSDQQARVVDEVEAVLREGSDRRKIQTEYLTPSGLQRFLAVTITPVRGEDGGLLGVACLISDVSELECIRREKDLQRELAAENALQLRSSLATISGYARQLTTRDSTQITQLAADIAQEAEQLDGSVGGFLSNRTSAQHVAAGRSS